VLGIYYTFNEGTGNVITNEVGNTAALTIGNWRFDDECDWTYVPPTCIKFYGTDFDRIDLVTPYEMGEEWTLECWT